MNYEKGRDCEFRADGKLRGGKIVGERNGKYIIIYNCPNQREIELDKQKVKIWNEKLGCHI